MRLTIRFLLAYLHGQLSEEEGREIERRLLGSEYAQELKSKLEQCIRSGASESGPPIEAGELAEYLDNALPHEDVEQLERACLQLGEPVLKEIGACHEILTWVLTRPVEPSRELRYRLHQLGSQAAAAGEPGEDDDELLDSALESDDLRLAPVEPPASSGWRPPPQPTLAPAKPAEPSTTQRGAPFWAAVGGLGVVVVVAFAVLFWPDGSHPSVAQGPTQDSAPADARSLTEEVVEGGSGAAAKAAPSDDPAYAAAPGIGVGDGKGSSPPAEPPQQPTVDPLVGPLPAAPAAIEPAVADAVSPAPAPAVVPAPAAVPDAAPGSPPPAALAPAAPPPPASLPAAPVSKTLVALLADTLPAASAPKKPAALARQLPAGTARQPAGTISSQPDQWLLRWEEKAGQWQRLRSSERLETGDSLLVLPRLRPQVKLVEGAELTIVGPAAVALAPASPRQSAVDIGYGSFAVQAPRKQVQLRVGGRAVTLTPGGNRPVMIDVVSQLTPGLPPSPKVVVWSRVYSGEGSLTVTWDGAEPLALRAGQMAAFRDGVPLDAPAAGRRMLPKATSRDEAAFKELSEATPEQEDAAPPLAALADPNRPKLSATLARQGLAQMGQFESLVAALDQPNNDWEWADSLALLRVATAHGPEAAGAAHHQLTQLLGPEHGTAAYRQLLGYDSEQFTKAAAPLVELLEHPRLAVRVIGFDTLRRATGTTQLYRPQLPVERQRSRVAAWGRLQSESKLKYRDPSPW